MTNSSSFSSSSSSSSVLLSENDSSSYICTGASDSELALYYRINWWTEGVLQVAVCTVGFLANALSIPVLCSKSMNSVFNRLLVALAVFDNLYLTFR
jgi:hypothetical protein